MRQNARVYMALRSVLAEITQSQQKRPIFSFRWMRYFFSEDMSPDNHSSRDLQRRAVWIGIALVLQSLNEVSHDIDAPLGIFNSVIPFILFIGSFYAMWMAIRPTDAKQVAHAQNPTALWQRITLTLIVLLTIGGVILLGRGIRLSFLPPEFTNDGTSLDTNAAILLTEGRNPYTDSNIPELFRRFNIVPTWTTPLRKGQLANQYDYPTKPELQSVFNTSLKAGDVPEFEARVSYPALSFLTLMPFAWLKIYNVLPFYILSYLAIVAIAWKMARPVLRPWVILLALANVPMWTSAVGGNLDIFYTLLVILAWAKRDNLWLSALFFGLALASKQLAWYFIPFYMIMTIRHYGVKETVYRMAIASSIGLVINLPFILWNPQAWFAGVMAPIADPMFPAGVGIISLSMSHLLPYFPTTIYSVLEYGSMLLTLVWYWRICRQRPEAAIFFAVLPLFLAWRSLSSYFYCVAFPLFVLMASKKKLSSHTVTTPPAQISQSAKSTLVPTSIGV